MNTNKKLSVVSDTLKIKFMFNKIWYFLYCRFGLFLNRVGVLFNIRYLRTASSYIYFDKDDLRPHVISRDSIKTESYAKFLLIDGRWKFVKRYNMGFFRSLVFRLISVRVFWYFNHCLNRYNEILSEGENSERAGYIDYIKL